MKTLLFFLVLATAAFVQVLGRPDEVLDYEGQDHKHEQEGEPGSSVHGEYSWTSPEGEHFSVSYVADEDGYRVSSDAVPEDHDGVAADGHQVD